MAISPQEQKEAAIGLTYAIKHLEQSIALVIGAIVRCEINPNESHDRNRRRLEAIKETLRNASNIREMNSASKFGTLGITFFARSDEDHRELLSVVRPNSYEEYDKYHQCVSKMLDRFDATIATYQLNYPIREESNTTASYLSNVLGNANSSSVPSAPPPTWIWDAHRNEYYRWSPIDNCYIYASGLILDANFQPIRGARVKRGQLAITNGGGGDEEVD